MRRHVVTKGEELPGKGCVLKTHRNKRSYKWQHAGTVHAETDLHALATETAGELDIAGHDGDTLGVDGAEVGVGQEGDHVALGGLLDGEDGRALEAETLLLGGGELTDEALEGSLADEELGALLVATDLAEGNGSRAPAVSALGTGGASGLLGNLGLGGLLGAGHGWVVKLVS
jgi:hypothetical protein